eukprot:GFUD01024016.1.p1 GENE.GFUD01024016.1~~GFUD01024016.1.p1  ORF type:complete len:277 (-),score=67.44 GFUD01024016.1:154-984(-)
MSLIGKIAKCLEPNSDLPTDVRFLFEMEGDQGNIVKEVRAHRLILAIASDAFKREFYGSMKEAEEEDVIVKDASQPVFQAMVDFIYNKQTALRVYELDFLASLYYLAEKFDLQDLKQGILAAIPEHEVTNENVLDVAILAEDSILHPPLSEALYVAAASFLKSKFNGKLENVVDFTVENESTQLHGLVLFKMLAMMKNIPVSNSARKYFGNKNYDQVYAMIRQSMDETGLDRDSIFNQLRMEMYKGEMDNALDFLSSEGHIYSTIDEDHFKTTAGD